MILLQIITTAVLFCSYIDAFHTVVQSLSVHGISRSKLLVSSSNNNDNIPTQNEIDQQKSEAYNALSSFHETIHKTTQSSSNNSQIRDLFKGLDTIGMSEEEISNEQSKAEYWECSDGAITYSVPIDRQAGLKKGIISKPYKVNVQIESDLSRKGLRLVESIQQFDESSSSSIPFVRSIALNERTDVDSADASYSFDDRILNEGSSEDFPTLPLLPQSLLGGIEGVTYLIEHTLAISETKRCRFFLLYGDSNDDTDNEEDFAVMAARKAKKKTDTEKSLRLLGVILTTETKVMPEEEEKQDDYAQDFISQMIEESPSSPLDLLEINQDSSSDDKMERLMHLLDKHNKRVIESGDDNNANKEMEVHDLGMFGLTSGVWLGDTFVREPISPQLSRARKSRDKGFAKKEDDGDEDRFANWSMGVQKVALHMKWDYSQGISQSYTYGKVMGTPTSFSSSANIKSDGMVVVNEARRTKKREERRVIIDYDGGQYVGGLLGSVYFRAPRYMTFSNSKRYSAEAYMTEFMVFYQPVNDEKDEDTAKSKSLEALLDEDVTPELYCSRISRLIANNGSLLQGSSAFFKLQSVLPEP